MKRIKALYEKTVYKLKNPFIHTILCHAPKYLTASMFNAIVGMMMNKYYTFVFTPVEFGVLSLYVVMYQYLQNLLMFTVDGAAQRVYFDYRDEQRKEFFGTIMLFSLVSIAFWVMIAVLVKEHVIGMLGGTETMYFVTIFLAIATVYTNLLNRIACNEQRSSYVLKQGFLQTILNHFSSLGFIAIFNVGLIGRQLGQAVAYAVSTLCYTQYLWREKILQITWAFNIVILKRLCHFALPSFLSIVLVTSLSFLDRVLLKHYHGAAEVGIYSLGLLIGQALSMVIEAMSMALFPSLMNELNKDYKEGIRRLKQFDVLFCCSFVLFALIIFFLRDFLVLILSNKKYIESAKVIPYIVSAYILGGFYKSVSLVLSFQGIVWFYPLLAIISYGIPALLSLILIPRYHEVGAAYAFFIGPFLYSLGMQLMGSRYYWGYTKIVIVYLTIFSIVTGYFLYQILK